MILNSPSILTKTIIFFPMRQTYGTAETVGYKRKCNGTGIRRGGLHVLTIQPSEWIVGKGFREEDFWGSFGPQNYFILLTQRIAKLELFSFLTQALCNHIDVRYPLISLWPPPTIPNAHSFPCMPGVFLNFALRRRRILPSIQDNPIHSCTLLLTHKAGRTENLKCSVLYLDSKAASAMSVEPSVAHFAMGRTVQASDVECHRSHNGIIPFWGLPPPGICSTVTMANATLFP